jgi:hypothetical protein
MSDGDSQIDAMMAALRDLPAIAAESAPDIARSFEAELKAQISAAVTPDGKAWAPKKDGSGKPLATAAKALTVTVAGPTVTAKLTGYIARHTLGRARGGVVRQILPDSISPKLAGDITRAITNRFTTKMGGG